MNSGPVQTGGAPLRRIVSADGFPGFLSRGGLVATITSEETHIFWTFVAARSGVAISLYDYRTPPPRSGLYSRRNSLDPHYCCQDVFRAIEDADELNSAALDAGVPLYSADKDLVNQALRSVEFYIDDEHDVVQWKKLTPPRARKPRQLTQKRIDGGEDMTV